MLDGEALESTREDTAITAFEQLFLERGRPTAGVDDWIRVFADGPCRPDLPAR